MSALTTHTEITHREKEMEKETQTSDHSKEQAESKVTRKRKLTKEQTTKALHNRPRELPLHKCKLPLNMCVQQTMKNRQQPIVLSGAVRSPPLRG
jgi:hypothetical protein